VQVHTTPPRPCGWGSDLIGFGSTKTRKHEYGLNFDAYIFVFPCFSRTGTGQVIVSTVRSEDEEHELLL
jgi:hypothetical protein